ncbi:MAG: UDP-glucose 6-dehydrogenase [Candidatus Saccharibacteria bacterium]|nr:UDP-glucose 6-dehydrogenase [Candidatus Saccharibacteria bacterium]
MTKVMIVGSGVVGGATGRGFAKHNADVTFVDVSANKLELLREEGFAAITPDQIDVSDVDLVFVAVPTPTNESGFVTDYLYDASRSIGRALSRAPLSSHPIIVYRSTMLPGTTQRLMIPLLEEESGKKAGVDFGVCYNPEYLREVSANEDFASLNIVTIGCNLTDSQDAKKVAAAYAPFNAVVHHLGIKEAEWHKYVHNLFNAIKISAFNEFRMMGEHLDISKEDVEKIFAITRTTAEGLYNSLYGTRDLGPYDGACLPKEVNATVHYAEEVGLSLPLLKATQEVNRRLGGQ